MMDSTAGLELNEWPQPGKMNVGSPRGVTPQESPMALIREEMGMLSAMARYASVIQLCGNGALFVSTAVVGKLGSEQLSAAAYAWAVINLTQNFFVDGANGAMSTLVSQASGAGNGDLVGLWLQTTLCYSFVLFPFAFYAWFHVGGLLTWAVPSLVESNPLVVDLASTYGRVSCLWLIPDTVAQCLERWLVARQVVKPLVSVNLFFLGLTVAANLLFVHGVCVPEPLAEWWLQEPPGDSSSSTAGDNADNDTPTATTTAPPALPATTAAAAAAAAASMCLVRGLGFVGAPLATFVCATAKACAIWLYACRELRLHESAWGGWDLREALHPARVRVFLSQALPATISPVLEQTQFLVVTLWAGSLGVVPLAAHTAMLNLFITLTCGMYGFSNACSARVGAFLGSGEPVKAKRTFQATLSCMVLMGLVVASVIYATRHYVGFLFSSDPLVIELASSISSLVAGFYLLLCFLYASDGTLQGQGRQVVIGSCMLLGAWGIAMPLCYLLTFGPLAHLGILGLWWGFIGGYFMCAAALLALACTSNWAELSGAARQRAEVEEYSGSGVGVGSARNGGAEFGSTEYLSSLVTVEVRSYTSADTSGGFICNTHL